MELSNRILGLTGGGSDGWDIFRRSREMIGDGTDVTELTIGEHDEPTSPGILAAMYASARAGHTGYAAIPGTRKLREAVARRTFDRTGVPTSPENVVITPGGQAALFACLMATCDAGQPAAMIDPYYATYPGTIRATGARVLTIPARPECGFEPTREDIEKAVNANARALLINSPNNPTGAVYSRSTLDAISDMCRAHGIWLISDEVYDSQLWEGGHLSPRQLPGMTDRTLVVGSMSKGHAMTGSRLGWAVGPEEAIDHLSNLSTHTTYGVPGFIQDAGEYALSRGRAMEDDISAPFRRRHAVTCTVLDKHGVPYVPSRATMYVMIDVRRTGLTGQDFATHLLEEHHIAVMPGESFGQAAAGHIRLALTVADDRLAAAVDTLARVYGDLVEKAA